MNIKEALDVFKKSDYGKKKIKMYIPYKEDFILIAEETLGNPYESVYYRVSSNKKVTITSPNWLPFNFDLAKKI